MAVVRARAGKWHCQVSLVVLFVLYETLYLASSSCYKQDVEAEAVKFLLKQKHFDEREWKHKRTWKRLILSGAASRSKNSKVEEAEVNSEA